MDDVWLWSSICIRMMLGMKIIWLELSCVYKKLLKTSQQNMSNMWIQKNRGATTNLWISLSIYCNSLLVMEMPNRFSDLDLFRRCWLQFFCPFRLPLRPAASNQPHAMAYGAARRKARRQRFALGFAMICALLLSDRERQAVTIDRNPTFPKLRHVVFSICWYYIDDFGW